MGSVYLASGQSGGFNKIVALKRIHGHLARDPKFVEMFLDEARVAARITHPNVCSVFDFGEIGGTYFIAMEYLMGETFSSIHRALRDRDRSEWVHHLAEIFAQAAEGLHAAHELCGDDGESLGVVHRDVSPQNLFLTYDGCAKVVDFGVARCAGRVLQTEPGTIKGKLAYVAPEQLRCHEIDRRSDVWALGVTLWEMLAGRTLFRRGNDIETLQAVVSDEIPPPTEMDPELPPELDAIVLRALSRDLDDRYPTARELSRALREFNRAKMAIVGQVELEEWMAELFPVQRREKQAMVQAARESSVIREPKSEASGREPTHTIVHHGPPEHMPLDHSRVSMPRAFWAGIGVSAAIAVALGGWIVAFTRPWPSEIDPVASSALEPGPLAGTITPHAEPREAELAPRPRRVPEEDRPAARDVTRAARDEAREESSERSRGRRGRPAVRELASAARAASTPRRERDSEPTDAGHATTDSGPSSAPDAATASAPVLVAEAPAPAEIARPVSTPTPAASAAPERSAPPVAPAPSPPRVAVAPRPSPALDARVEIDALRMGGSLPMSQVRHAIARVESEYEQCYRSAARRAGRDGTGAVAVRFTIDEMGMTRRPTAAGGPLPGLASCIGDATGHVRPRLRPDTGTVDVSFDVRFTPRPAGGR